MSQTVCIIEIETVDGTTGEYVTVNGVPYDKEDFKAEAEDQEIYGDAIVKSQHYEIGEGESGDDELFTVDELTNLIQEFGNIDVAMEAKGIDCYLVDTDECSVHVSDDTEEEW